MLKKIILLCLLCAAATMASGGENNFETTSLGMINQLSGPPTIAPEQSQDFVLDMNFSQGRTRGNSSAINNSIAAVKTRAIQRISKDQSGRIVEEIVQMPLEQKTAHVNLKIEFAVNSYAIQAKSYPIIEQLGEALNSPELAGKRFYINGHTDADGSDSANLRLSLNRAQSIKQFLCANYGVQENNLIIIGYGESMPIGSNGSYAGKQLNRRVEIVIR